MPTKPLLRLLLVVGLAANGPLARAQYRFCDEEANSIVACACPLPDGGPGLQHCCQVGSESCLQTLHHQPTGEYTCCGTGIGPCRPGYFVDGSCVGDPSHCALSPPNTACHPDNDLCNEGKCVPDPPQVDFNTGTMTGRLNAHCDTTDARTSSCNPYPDTDDHCEERKVGDWHNKGDPVNVPSQSSRHDVTDLSLRGSIAEFSFNRSYVSSEKTWAHETSLGTLDGPFLPKPFGSSANWPASLRWWHSLYSFVFPQGWIANASLWSVREGNGRLLDFLACSDGNTSCFATPARRFSETRTKLYWQAAGGGNGSFILFKDNSRSVFADVWAPPVSGPGKRYFLSRIEDGQYPASGGASRVLSQLSYAVPDPGCPGQSTVGNPGVPYLGTVTTEDGAQVHFHYRFVATFRPSPPRECVLASVSLSDRSGGGEPTLVQYTYATDGGTEAAGLLASSRWPALDGGVQAYQYEPFTVIDNGTPMTQHVSAGDVVFQDNQLTPNGLATFVDMTQTQSSVRCDGGTLSPFCESAAVQNLGFPTMSYGGDSPPSHIAAPRDYLLETTSQSMGPRVKSYTDSCPDGYCANSSPGTVSWVFNQLPSSNFVTQAVQDKRSSWVAYGYAVPQSLPADAGFLLPAERTAVYKGASAPDGGNALEVTTYGYTYGGASQTPRAYEQLRNNESRPSVLQSGQNVSTQYIYDTATNRLKAVVKSGYTQTFDGVSWTRGLRFIGTFYFTRHVCLNDADDALGRTLEIHGPCLVAGASSTDCDVAPLANTPITQYFYWPSSPSNNNANKLQKVSRFPQTGGPSSCTGVVPLDTLYDNYDARGNPLKVTDPNGVATFYTYEENRVTSETTSNRITNYAYEHGKVTSIRHPEGNFEVFCYRRDCIPWNPWTGQVLHKKKALSPDYGAPWIEQVTYGYNTNNQIVDEAYSDPYYGQRRERHFHPDGRGRPTWEGDGLNNPGWGHYETKRLFDGADNMTGIGLPYNNPLAFCGGADAQGQPVSPLCAALSYDRANRVTGLDEFPWFTGSATRTCLGYDTQGNVNSVVSGCAASGPRGTCTSCTQPVSNYQYDDFGNLLSATLPWTDNGTGASGTLVYDYDARGNLIHKQSPAMASTGDFLIHSYDGLGRELSLYHTYTLPSSGSEPLYTLGYDESAALDSSCPAPTNTRGRLLYRNDSFGQTWYQYDIFGEVTREIRLRQGVSTCSPLTPNANPHTVYTYSRNGDLTSIAYPYGRTVNYSYGTNGRISSISVTRFDGTGWIPVENVISNIAWEPYGGLRGYQINHPGSSSASSVEYVLGDYLSPPGSGTCPTVIPADPSSGNERAGRLKALWVSTLAAGDNFFPGHGNGAIERMTYTFQADQVKQIDTCLLDATVPRTEVYGPDPFPGYDQLLRLTNAGRSAGNFAATGGAFNSRAYGYSGRGNRISETREDCAYALTYGNATHPDQLTQQASSCPSSILSHRYAYDADGRVNLKTWENDSSQTPAYSLNLSYGETDTASHGALDTVFKGVGVNGMAYDYFYDAQNRRRLKVYPLGPTDEFFYDMGHQMLVDQGNDSGAAPSFYPDDDYIWLGRRPVLLIRGKLDTSWNRQPTARETALEMGMRPPAASTSR